MIATLEAEEVAKEVSLRSGNAGNAEQTVKRSVQDELPFHPPRTQTGVPPAVIPPPNAIRAMDKGRFASGLLLSSVGIGCLLMIAVGTLQQSDIAERFSMPIVACAAIMGIMMLGGGFGLMATAAAGFDDREFDRLLEAGNISAAETSERFSRQPEQTTDVAEAAKAPDSAPSSSLDDVDSVDLHSKDVV